jgi:hypothetical protein
MEYIICVLNAYLMYSITPLGDYNVVGLDSRVIHGSIVLDQVPLHYNHRAELWSTLDMHLRHKGSRLRIVKP